MKELQQKLYMWQGRMQELHERREALSLNVAQNKDFMQEKDVVMDFLEKLQQKEHERAVGKFEGWLTALLQEVFGVSNQSIVLDLHTDYNKVGLDILLNKDGELEDLYSGNGGAYTNLIATGLRLIATAVTQRAFLVLDEPDCWIRADILPNFIDVITRYSRELGIQVILISHHSLSGLSDREFILENDNKKTWISDIIDNDFGFEDKNEHTKIESVQLKNFMQYEDVTFELSPFVNLFTGVNNIGKSGLVQGLRCVFYNEKPHNFIRHGEKSSDIFINFNTKQQLFYTAKQTKSSKSVIWRLVDENAPAQEKLSEEERNKDDPEHMILKTTGVKSFPEWIEKISSIGLIDEIDIQLGLQKKPSSILEGTPNERAMVLSLNKESSYAQKMMDEFKIKCKKAQEIIKKGEEDLTEIDQKLKADPFVVSLSAKIESLENTKEEMDEKNQLKEWAENLLGEWQESSLVSNLPNIPKVDQPNINNNLYWEQSSDVWNDTQKYNTLPSINLCTFDEIVKSKKEAEEITKYSHVLIDWEKAISFQNISIPDKLNLIDKPVNIDNWNELLLNWSNSIKLREISGFDLPKLAKHPSDIKYWKFMLSNWKASGIEDIEFLLPNISNIRNIQDNYAWLDKLDSWKDISGSLLSYKEELQQVDEQRLDVESKFKLWEDKCGNVCPLCQSKLSSKHKISHFYKKTQF